MRRYVEWFSALCVLGAAYGATGQGNNSGIRAGTGVSQQADAITAGGDRKNQVAMVFAMDCGGHRRTMKNLIERELAGMKAAAGNVPVFGFYGSGEIGHADRKSPAKGVGFSIAAAAIIGE